MKSQITSNQMTPEQMLDLARKNNLTVWAMVRNTWKKVTEITGDWITIEDWIVPSEIGKTRCIPVSQATEFDLTC
jgi:hypothetical protein